MPAMPKLGEGRSRAIRFVAAASCHALASAKADDCRLLLNPAKSGSTENNRQPEQDDCDRHERRAGDVSEQDEEDRDNGEDCCEVVVHSFPTVYRVRLSAARFLNGIDFAWGCSGGRRGDRKTVVTGVSPAMSFCPVSGESLTPIVAPRNCEPAHISTGFL